jgi:hypothetical protein
VARPEDQSDPVKPPRGDQGHLALDRAAAGESLRLYLSETAPSEIEKRSLPRWMLLALGALVLHILLLYVAPRFAPPVPPAPIEVQQIDPAKLAAVKNRWKERGFLLSKDESKPKENVPTPKNARYESDRNRAVEKETRARKTNVIPNVPGQRDATADRDRKAAKNPAKSAKSIPLSNLSNFQSLPVPGPRRDEQESARRGGPGDAGDQAILDDVPEGAENMLNTAESVYYTFYARIYEQIGPLWQSNVRNVVYRKKLGAGDYVTRVDVVFDSDGNYLECRMISPSGIEELDAVVPASWARVPRFPNPPKGLIQPDGKIHMGWGFTVRIDPNLQWNYVPPERAY